MEHDNFFENNPKFLRASEVAALLDVSVAFAYRLLQTGAIPSIRMAGVVRVDPADLKAYIEACKVSGNR